MLSPADLIELAENFAFRIPRDAAFEDERQVSWELVRDAYLRAGDADGAARALAQFSSAALEALNEPADASGDEIPESLAQHAVELMGKAQEALAAARAVLGPQAVEPVDSPADRLSRFLHYRYNDLKIRWLVEQASAGGVADADLAARLESEEFQRLEPPRQPSIYHDRLPSEPSEFGRFLFARPIPLRESDKDLLDGDHMRYGWRDERTLVRSATALFLAFELVSQSYSQDQIEQGLWFLFGNPLWLFEKLAKGPVPQAERLVCVEAMLVPFRDYYQHAGAYEGSGFFMWWDHTRDLDMEIAVRARQTLEKILQLPHRGCEFAAIHGLNHLRPDVEASALVARYLEERRTELKPDDIAWIERCRDGKAI